MAQKKKPRAPQPPRKVQAPKQRTGTPGGPRTVGSRVWLYVAGGVAALVVLALIGFFALGSSGGTGEKQVASLMSAAGCNFKTVTAYVPPGQGVHVKSLTKKFPWNTDPPSNGQHYPVWAVWGFYTQPVNPRMVVHNEEHGGVILWWGTDVPGSTVEQLRAFYSEQPDGTFGTPYPKLGGKVAISAWTGDPAKYGSNNYFGQGHLAICPRVDAATLKAFDAFRKAYRGHGPEGIPLSLDEPGMGPQ
ncbi:MAG TPA: DUF3105 domain-containing protein [Gaiellaceae bacterium]